MYSNDEMKAMLAPIIEKYRFDRVYIMPNSLHEKLAPFYSIDKNDPNIEPDPAKYPFLVVYHGRPSIGDFGHAADEIEKLFPERTKVEFWNCSDFDPNPEDMEIIGQILNKTEGTLIYESEDGAEDRLFFITKGRDNGTDEPVKELHCTEEEAYQEFLKVVDEQSREYHIDKTLEHWRVVRLYDSKLNRLAQES